MRVTRWPLHPRPIAGEEISSWLGRIAVLYELPVKDLLVHDLGHSALSDVELDLAPPETLLSLLSERTGVSVGRLRSMTLKGWTRAWVGRGKPGAALFSRYVKRHSVLLSPNRRDGKKLDQWRPWITVQRFDRSVGCPACLSTDEIPYRRLHWRLALIASCPAHGILLEPVMPPHAWRIQQILWREERHFASERLLALDQITLQALTCGHATLPHNTLPTRVWLRLLRTILDELNTTAATAADDAHVIKAIWRSVELPVRDGARVAQPFEDMDFPRQAHFMNAAAEAIELVSSHRLEVQSRDAHLLCAPSPRRRAITPAPVLKTTEPWREALKAADALLKAAHATPKGARELRALLLLGSSKPETIARVERFLTGEEGIGYSEVTATIWSSPLQSSSELLQSSSENDRICDQRDRVTFP